MIDDSVFLCFCRMNWSFELLWEILRLFGQTIIFMCCAVLCLTNVIRALKLEDFPGNSGISFTVFKHLIYFAFSKPLESDSIYQTFDSIFRN